MNRSLVSSLALAATLLAAPLATAASRIPVWTPTGATALASGWTYSGCWTRTTGGTCYDIYRDSSGQAWICKACRTTKGPGPGKCSKISQAELDAGRWCS